MAGIVSLMKSKLSAMVIYRASILSIPKTLAEQNDQKVFLVGGRVKNPFSLIGKKKVTKSGLGWNSKDGQTNKALSAKLLWRLKPEESVGEK